MKSFSRNDFEDCCTGERGSPLLPDQKPIFHRVKLFDTANLKHFICEGLLASLVIILLLLQWHTSSKDSTDRSHPFPHIAFQSTVMSRPTYDPTYPLWINEHDLDNITVLERKLDILFEKGWKSRFILAHEFIDIPNIDPFRINDTDFLEVSGFHELHCLAYLLDSLGKARLGLEPGKPIEHTIHCFNYLRQSLQCLADGTLEDKSIHIPGRKVQHICNDYGLLVDWVQDPVRRVPESLLYI